MDAKGVYDPCQVWAGQRIASIEGFAPFLLFECCRPSNLCTTVYHQIAHGKRNSHSPDQVSTSGEVCQRCSLLILPLQDSPDQYMDTIQQLMVAMTFSDGNAAISPTCFHKDCLLVQRLICNRRKKAGPETPQDLNQQIHLKFTTRYPQAHLLRGVGRGRCRTSNVGCIVVRSI